MKLYLIEREDYTYDEDYGAVVAARTQEAALALVTAKLWDTAKVKTDVKLVGLAAADIDEGFVLVATLHG